MSHEPILLHYAILYFDFSRAATSSRIFRIFTAFLKWICKTVIVTLKRITFTTRSAGVNSYSSVPMPAPNASTQRFVYSHLSSYFFSTLKAQGVTDIYYPYLRVLYIRTRSEDFQFCLVIDLQPDFTTVYNLI